MVKNTVAIICNILFLVAYKAVVKITKSIEAISSAESGPSQYERPLSPSHTNPPISDAIDAIVKNT